MFADNDNLSTRINRSRLWAWISIVLTIILLGIGVWYLLTHISLTDMVEALAQVRSGYLWLAILSIVLTFLVKTWRWQFLLGADSSKPPFSALFWALTLGVYVNSILPFLRLGEIARAYALHFQTGVSKIQSLSTLVVEKALEAVFLGLTIAVLIPFLTLTKTSQQPNNGILLGIVALIALIAMYTIAYQADWVLRQVKRFTRLLPPDVGNRILQISISSLKGLSALREQRLSLIILGTSLLVAILYVLTPYLLFLAFGISLGLAEAAAIHVVVFLAQAPPSTPVKIGIFDGAVAFMLVQFGIENEALVAAYTIIFHLVTFVPPIIFGSIAASRTQWRWQKTAVPSPRRL